MNIIDLELYRWQFHRMSIDNSIPGAGSSKISWWLEFGAFVSILPRQSGKTEMLIKIANLFQKNGEDFVFVVPRLSMKTDLLRRSSIDKNKIEVLETITVFNTFLAPEKKIKNINLLVDEYTLLNNTVLKELFKWDWKSVSMTGGLKL